MNNYKNLDTSKLNYIIYCRKSSEGEDKQVQSLDTQLRELEDHAKRNGLNIIEVISESKSAFKIGRPGFDRMMNLIKIGKANAVLVIRANRISRNSIDAGYAISLMDEKKLLYIRTPNSTCYTCSSTDKMMIALELIFSKKDSDEKGDMVKEGQMSKALKGIPHGRACLGFLNDKSEEKGNRKWLIDEIRLGKIKILLDMFLTGTHSAGKLYKYAINDLKLTTVGKKRQGGQLIVMSRIYEILKDPIYSGFFFYGGERYELDRNLPRLITEAQHNKIKQILSRKNIPKSQHHEAVYAGFIQSTEGNYMGLDPKFQVICDCKKKFAYRDKTHCPQCRVNIDRMENPKYLDYSHYYDVKKKKASLPYKCISEKNITKEMIKYINENLNFSNDLLEWSKKYIYEMKDQEVSAKVLISKDRENRKEDYELKKSKLRGMLRDGKITDDEYNIDLEFLNKEYTDTNIEVQNVDWYQEMMDITNLTQGVVEVLQNGSFQSKRNILSKLGSNLVWNDEKLSIYNRKSIEALVKGIKSIKSIYPKFEPSLSFAEQGLNEKTSEFSLVNSTMLPR
ncbi:MAG: recombinase family protein [Candidatus Nomurabacteria bacterium]|nr:recombinase family protein [Candidatus Nomurabacteria bacterium]